MIKKDKVLPEIIACWDNLQIESRRLISNNDYDLAISKLVESALSSEFKPIDSKLNRQGTRSRVLYFFHFLNVFKENSQIYSFFNRSIDNFPKIRFLKIAYSIFLSSIGERDEAITAITEALSLHYDDLYAQEIFLELSSPPGIEYEKSKTNDLKDCFCNIPFDDFKIFQGGQVFQCCANWLPYPIGNVFNYSWRKVWNSEAAKEIRRSILDGDFSYCSRLSCPLIQEGLPKKDEIKDPRHRLIIESGDIDLEPIFLNISYDDTCNLSCPSCRSNIRRSSEETIKSFNNFFDKDLIELVNISEQIFICSTGDPFASKHYTHIFNKIKSTEKIPKIQIQTNANLLTTKQWKNLGKLVKQISRIEVSIDASTADTYEIVRRGGNFNKLIKNMNFISDQKKKYGFYLQLDYCVQEENFLEMKTFVELGHHWNVDNIYFSRLRNWGSYAEGEYLKRAITNPGHPRHNEFIELIQDKIFSDKIVSMGDFSDLCKSHEKKL